jgi:hypothetical protein
VEAISRKRNQPAPPHVLYEALTQPNRDPSRPWLLLQEGELTPAIVKTEEPNLVVWSSLWSERPEATIRFELPRDDAGQGTDLRWTLELDEPLPDRTRLIEMRKRINLLINGNLRDTFDQ